MKKIGKMNEAAWLLGIILCSLGIALCTKAGFGLSMIAAPPYILHRWLSPLSSVFTQGVCEYLWQGVILVILCLAIKRFRWRYLLAFGTAVVFGLVLDLWFILFGGNAACESLPLRIVLFVLGEGFTALAIAFFFRTKLPLQIYELFVTEFAGRYKLTEDKTKFGFDLSMLALSMALALLLNRSFDGLGIGTLIITAVNALLIGLFGKLLDKLFTFEPRFPRLTRLLGGE
ncbi:MAG: hypothetical protein IJD10_03120 [Clostridia bacterium]|nr:hypothetical protein [Clostridia bacterium]